MGRGLVAGERGVAPPLASGKDATVEPAALEWAPVLVRPDPARPAAVADSVNDPPLEQKAWHG